MVARINDAQIRTFTTKIAATPEKKISDQNVLELLAGVGDKWGSASASVLTQLTKPGITRQEQFDLAKAGLSATEKTDLTKLLDGSGLTMDPGAKNFIEALVGRAALTTTMAPLTITGDQRAGLSGIAKPGEVIEAINLSTAPAGRLHLTDTMEIGKADAAGKFNGQLPDMREGDIIRLRTRAADGSTGDWLTIQAKGIEASDTRNAHANLERIDLAANPDGTVNATANTARPITEPGAKLQITNTRTGEKQLVTADDKGSLPAGLKLKGQKGDTFSIAVSDGKNNVDFRTAAGTLKVPGGTDNGTGVNLPDPGAVSDDRNADGTAKFSTTRFSGPLFIDGAKADDVRQGAIGNCYFPAALASIAYHQPEVIKNMVKQNDDGTYSVTFKQYGRPVEVKVDGDLFARSWGGPVYGSSLGGSTEPTKMEMWFPIVEKAYAQWKGGTDKGYDAIGHGGVAGQVMGEVMGKDYDYLNLSPANADRMFDTIVKGAANKQPMAAGTYGTDQASRYTNTGVYANHAYTVMGAEVGADGKKYVQLRNPWGQSEPGNDGKNDGIFKLELSQFVNLYRALHVVEQ